MKYKDSKFDELQLLQLFFFVDDACLLMRAWVEQHWLAKGEVVKKPNRIPKISESEMLTIIIFYHYSGYKCFEYYYNTKIILNLRKKSYALTFRLLIFDS
jgi:hypothetical protein